MDKIKVRLNSKIELYNFIRDTYMPILADTSITDPQRFIRDVSALVYTYLEGKYSLMEMYEILEELAKMFMMELPENRYHIFVNQFSRLLTTFNAVTAQP